MGLALAAVFLGLCLMAVRNTGISITLCLILFAAKQLLQALVPYFRDSYFGSQLPNIAVAIAVGLCGFRLAVSDPSRLLTLRNSLLPVIGGIFVYAAISCLWSPAGSEGISQFQGAVPYLLLYLVIVPIIVTSVAELTSLWRPLLIIATVIALLILVNPEFQSRSGRLTLNLGFTSAKSITTNALAVGSLGGLCAIIGTLFTSPGMGLHYGLIRLLAIGIGTALMVRSGSRGQLLFAAMAVVAAYPIGRVGDSVFHSAGRIVSLAIILCGAALIAIQIRNQGSIIEEQRWSLQNASEGTEIRLSNISQLINQYIQSPLYWMFGLGFLAYAAIDPEQVYSHNLTVDMLAELGIVGFTAYVWVLWKSVRSAKYLNRACRDDDPEFACSLRCLIGLIVYQWLLSQKQGNLVGSVELFALILVLSQTYRSCRELIEVRLEDPLLLPQK